MIKCKDCGAETLEEADIEGPGRPVLYPGTKHFSNCAIFGGMFNPNSQANRELQERLDEIDTATRQAWLNAAKVFIR